MKIVNMMFGRKLGGLEQVFADYSEALLQGSAEVMSLVQPGAEITQTLKRIGAPYKEFSNFNQYDFWAARKIKRYLREFRPDAVIAQGNRAIALGRRAAAGVAPLVAVNHSINIRRTIGADAVIAINEDMRSRLIASGQPAERVFKLFNMIKPPAGFSYQPRPYASPPVIAAIGRFVTKKRFDIFLDALAILGRDGADFRAIIAGGGELEAALKQKAEALGLTQKVSFPGWVEDKDRFYRSFDIFCFSSEHDVCPVVLLEAYLYGKPVVMTNPAGPAEIATPGKDALLVPINDAKAMAEALGKLIRNPHAAQALGQAAHAKAMAHFTMAAATPKLIAILRQVASHSSLRTVA